MNPLPREEVINRSGHLGLHYPATLLPAKRGARRNTKRVEWWHTNNHPNAVREAESVSAETSVSVSVNSIAAFRCPISVSHKVMSYLAVLVY